MGITYLLVLGVRVLKKGNFLYSVNKLREKKGT